MASRRELAPWRSGSGISLCTAFVISQRYRRLRREEPERKTFLEIKGHLRIVMAQITDRQILPDDQLEIIAAHRDDHRTIDGGAQTMGPVIRRCTC
jgi:hypothetical protein